MSGKMRKVLKARGEWQRMSVFLVSDLEGKCSKLKKAKNLSKKRGGFAGIYPIPLYPGETKRRRVTKRAKDHYRRRISYTGAQVALASYPLSALIYSLEIPLPGKTCFRC